MGVVLAWPLRVWALPLLALMFGWAAVHARQWIRRLGWAATNDAVLFRSGWVWRNTTIAPLGKIQIVAVHESPFDRRLRMAGVVVDTAGASGESHRVHIPYLVPRHRRWAGRLARRSRRALHIQMVNRG